MTVLLVAWLLIAVALPCFSAFRASYRRNGRMMLILLGLPVIYTFVIFMGTVMLLSTQPITPEAAGRISLFLALLLFGIRGAGVGRGWPLRGRF